MTRLKDELVKQVQKKHLILNEVWSNKKMENIEGNMKVNVNLCFQEDGVDILISILSPKYNKKKPLDFIILYIYYNITNIYE